MRASRVLGELFPATVEEARGPWKAVMGLWPINGVTPRAFQGKAFGSKRIPASLRGDDLSWSVGPLTTSLMILNQERDGSDEWGRTEAPFLSAVVRSGIRRAPSACRVGPDCFAQLSSNRELYSPRVLASGSWKILEIYQIERLKKSQKNWGKGQ